MTTSDIPDEHLLYLVSITDKELFDAGFDIKRRYWEVPKAVMMKLGNVSYIMAGQGKPKILERIEDAFASIYRKEDIAVGGHIGMFMYRDIFARIGVPTAYGRVSINPFDYVELTPVQMRIIQTEPEETETYIDQFWDLADVQYGIREIKKPYAGMELVCRFIDLARLHLHSASAVLTGGYDYRGASQSALLATELALKAGAAAQGLTEAEIKAKFGHKTDKIADFVGGCWKSFDLARVNSVIVSQPEYVPNRYSAQQPDRLEVGHLVMGTQFLASEVVRHLSDRNFRSSFSSFHARRYPGL